MTREYKNIQETIDEIIDAINNEFNYEYPIYPITEGEIEIVFSPIRKIRIVHGSGVFVFQVKEKINDNKYKIEKDVWCVYKERVIELSIKTIKEQS